VSAVYHPGRGVLASATLRIAHPERVFTLRIAYLEYRDRFEAVGVADLNHDDLADVFRGLLCT
jgi:hypothetical protein